MFIFFYTWLQLFLLRRDDDDLKKNLVFAIVLFIFQRPCRAASPFTPRVLLQQVLFLKCHTTTHFFPHKCSTNNFFLHECTINNTISLTSAELTSTFSFYYFPGRVAGGWMECVVAVSSRSSNSVLWVMPRPTVYTQHLVVVGSELRRATGASNTTSVTTIGNPEPQNSALIVLPCFVLKPLISVHSFV